MDAREKKAQRRKNRISFSATLPTDVSGAFANSVCAVRYSSNPFVDIRMSILEMIVDVGVHDWDQMEELVYCYVALNSPELHHLICQAFVSLCCPLCNEGQN
ncbi:hypothetical protein VNO77_31851 [Canavalia gladiata]|uniref:Transcription repressor n=1 Tax=Canavalia gladiata TaxID=3824 RepID=A0AAN9KSU1_CANGL